MKALRAHAPHRPAAASRGGRSETPPLSFTRVAERIEKSLHGGWRWKDWLVQTLRTASFRSATFGGRLTLTASAFIQ
jgi:hypothetical protein